MNIVNQDWNGMELSYVVDYHDEQPRDYWQGAYVAEIQEPGSHTRSDEEMQGAPSVTLASQELPPQISSAGLCEPSCPNPFLGKGDAPNALDCGVYHAEAGRASPAKERWNPYSGARVVEMAEFEPTEAWRLGRNDLQSMFLDYFRSEDDEHLGKLNTAVTATQYEVLREGLTTEFRQDSYLAGLYDQVWASEGWTEAEVSEVSYVLGFVPAAEAIPMEAEEKPRCEPELILTVD